MRSYQGILVEVGEHVQEAWIGSWQLSSSSLEPLELQAAPQRGNRRLFMLDDRSDLIFSEAGLVTLRLGLCIGGLAVPDFIEERSALLQSAFSSYTEISDYGAEKEREGLILGGDQIFDGTQSYPRIRLPCS